jgi:hypothetical protein
MGPPPPHPQASVAPPPLWILRGGDTLACGEEVGAPSSDDWPVSGVGTGIEENKYMLFLIGSTPHAPCQLKTAVPLPGTQREERMKGKRSAAFVVVICGGRGYGL